MVLVFVDVGFLGIFHPIKSKTSDVFGGSCRILLGCPSITAKRNRDQVAGLTSCHVEHVAGKGYVGNFHVFVCFSDNRSLAGLLAPV